MNDNYAFVDLQGFIGNNNRFVVKEIAIITRNISFHDIVKSTPSTFSDLDAAHKKQVKWLTYNFHGLKWHWGFITLQQLRRAIEPILNEKIVYIKGDKKVKWLEQILGFKWGLCRIIDIESLNSAVSLSMNNGCTYQKFQVCKNHNAMKNKIDCHCAFKNVLIIQNWFQNNEESVKAELLNM